MTQTANLTPEPNPVGVKAKLLRSTGVVSAMTMISRILGLVRDVVFATMFPVGAGTDAFFIAFKIPNFLRRLFAEGAFAQAFVPVLTEYKTTRDKAAVRELIAKVEGTLGVTLLTVTLLAVMLAPYLVMLFAPGFLDQPLKLAMATDMLRYTFPYLFFISLTAFASSILNTYGRFAVPAFTPVLLNVSLIGAAVWVAPHISQNHGVMALAYGVVVAGMAQLAFQLPALRGEGLLVRPNLGFNDPGVKQIMTLMLPALFGVSVSQINLLLDTVLASFLQTGSISWLYYSDRLTELPLGVFGIAVATVILPSLSAHHTKESPQAFSHTLDWGLRTVLVVGIPATVALLILAEPLLTTLFYHGSFTLTDVEQSARSLRAYSLGVVAFMLVKVLAPGFFARQDTKAPMKIGIIAMVVNMVLNLCLIYWLAHAGLALATTLAACLNAWLLYRGLRKAGVYTPEPGWPLLWARLSVAALLMGALLWHFSPDLSQWVAWLWWQRAAAALLICSGGGLSYFILLALMGLRFRHFRR